MIRSRIAGGETPRVLANAGVLLSGDALGYLFGFVALALAARGLPAEDFGVLVLVQSYAEAVETLVTFQSWQGIIHFGAGALQEKRDDDFRALIRLGMVVDVISGIFGALVAVVAAVLLQGLLGWTDQTMNLAIVVGLGILAPPMSMPVAVLRLFGRFSVLAKHAAVTGGVRLLAIAVAYLLGLELTGFVIVWLATDVFERSVLMALAWLELRQRGHRSFWRGPIRGVRSRFPGLSLFLVSSNLVASVKVVPRYLDVLIVGNLLGPAAAGTYRIGKQLATAIAKLTDPVYEAVYPELSVLWAQRRLDAFRTVALQLGLLCGIIGCLGWLALAVFGRWGISVVFGREYLQAFPMMMWMMAGMVIALFFLPLGPTILAMGRATSSLAVLIIASAVYVLVLVPLIDAFGLTGAGVALLVYYLVWASLLAVPTASHLRRARRSMADEQGTGVAGRG
jgi:O-antigen/teichoic acid export membrane protein